MRYCPLRHKVNGKQRDNQNILFSDEITAKENNPPEVVEADETDIVHLTPRHHFAFFGVDSFEEAIEALHSTLGHKTRVQLQDLRLEKLAVDVWVEVGLFTHQFREPFEAGLAICHKNGPLHQTVPDLTRLRGAQP